MIRKPGTKWMQEFLAETPFPIIYLAIIQHDAERQNTGPKKVVH
jgi:hypothetical protein